MSFYRRVLTPTGLRVHLSNNVRYRRDDEQEWWEGKTLCSQHCSGDPPLDIGEYDGDGVLCEDTRPVDCQHCLGAAKREVFLLSRTIAGDVGSFDPNYVAGAFEPWHEAQAATP